MTDRMRTAFLRSQWKISTQLAVIDSSTEMQEVSVAKIAVTKNSAPTTTPAAVLCREIGEAPEIPDTDCVSGSREHEAELPGKMIRFLFYDVFSPSVMLD